jgi:hypothetical protein
LAWLDVSFISEVRLQPQLVLLDNSAAKWNSWPKKNRHHWKKKTIPQLQITTKENV